MAKRSPGRPKELRDPVKISLEIERYQHELLKRDTMSISARIRQLIDEYLGTSSKKK